MKKDIVSILRRGGLLEDPSIEWPTMHFEAGGSASGDSGSAPSGGGSDAGDAGGAPSGGVSGDPGGVPSGGGADNSSDTVGDSGEAATDLGEISITAPPMAAELSQLQSDLGVSATEAAMMSQVTTGNVGVATNGMTQAELSMLAANGLGNSAISSTQTVNQALASMAVHGFLNNNIGQIMGAIGGPALGAIATAANAVAQGHSIASVMGQMAASVVGSAISAALGVTVTADTISAIANGQIGQAALGMAIGNIASSTGISPSAVAAALSGNLGAAVANSVTSAVVGNMASSMSTGQLGNMAIGAIASLSGVPASIASSVNQSEIGQAVNSATSAMSSAVASSGTGVPGGVAGIGAAVSAAEAGGPVQSQSEILQSATDKGTLDKAKTITAPVPSTPSAPKKKVDYWGNLYSDLSSNFSKPPATPANNSAATLTKAQETATNLLKAQEDYTSTVGQLTAEAALAISSAADPVKYVDSLYTSKSEASEIWKNTIGTTPTEFDLIEMMGLTESDAKDIVADRGTTTTEEATSFLREKYGNNYQPSTDELMQLVSKPESTAKNTAQNIYTKDKNSVTKDEAIEFLEKAGLKESDVTQTQLESALKGSEPGVETFFQTLADRKTTTFDGSDYERQSDAQAQAIRSGFNTYEWGGKDYTIMSPEQAKQLQADRASGKNVGVSSDQIFIPVQGKTLEQQLKDAGNPDEYAYEQGDTIVIVSKKLAVPDYNDTEAWNAFKAEKAALGGDTFKTLLTEQFSILEQAMKGAPKDSVANVMANAAMFGYGKMAQLAETFSRTGEAMGIPQAERGTNIAKQVQSWSNKLVDQGIQNAEAAVLANVAAVTKESIASERGVKPSDISTAELYAQKTAALFKQVPNNPLGVSLFLTGEAIQEIPLLAVSGGVGSVFKNVIGKSVGLSAAVGTNVALNGAESFGGNYGEVKEYLRKQGVPEAQIEALAVKSGLEAMAVGMMTSYVGDRALIKSFMGDIATDSFTKVVATNSAREWFMGNFEGSLQNMSAQIGKYGSIKSEDEWLNAGIMEGFAQKGIAAGVLTADALSRPVAKDYDGKPVTYKEVIEGTKTFDPKTLDKEFSFGNGVNLGDALGYHSTFLTNPDITPDEYFYAAQTFRDNGMNDFSPQEIASLVGNPGELSRQQITEVAAPYAQGKVVTPQEAQQMARDLGYTNLKDSEAIALAGQISEADAQARVSQYVDPRQVTRQEAESFFSSILGYQPTEAEIASFVRQGSDVSQEAVKSEVGAYVDPRMVDKDEAKAAYEAIGLKKPTQADIQKMIGQYSETDLAGKAAKNLDSARYNSLLEQIEQIGTQAGVDPAVLQTIKNDINAQITSLGGDVTKLQSGLNSVISGQAAVQKDVAALEKLIGGPSGKDVEATGIIAQLEAMGLKDSTILEVIGKPATETAPATGLYKAADDAAVRGESAADAVQKEMAKIIGASSVKDDPATLDVDESLAATGLYGQMEAASADVQEKYAALSAAQKATANALIAQGTTLTEAIAAAQTATATQIAELGAQNKEMAGLIGTQGRAAGQTDIDALSQMLSGAKPVDLTYDVTGDKQITQADIDFLTQVIGGTKTDWTAPVGSAFGPTGLYGQLATSEAQRKADVQAQIDREAEAARVRAAKEAADEAARVEAARRAKISGTLAQGQQSLQSISQQLPQALKQAQEVSTPLYGTMEYFDPFGDPFANQKMRMASSTNPAEQSKMAAGGYIDDLLAGDMTVDDLLNLLR